MVQSCLFIKGWSRNSPEGTPLPTWWGGGVINPMLPLYTKLDEPQSMEPTWNICIPSPNISQLITSLHFHHFPLTKGVLCRSFAGPLCCEPWHVSFPQLQVDGWNMKKHETWRDQVSRNTQKALKVLSLELSLFVEKNCETWNTWRPFYTRHTRGPGLFTQLTGPGAQHGNHPLFPKKLDVLGHPHLAGYVWSKCSICSICFMQILETKGTNYQRDIDPNPQAHDFMIFMFWD